MPAAQELLTTTWSAVQASVSVILVLLYGYVARRTGLMTGEGESNASKLSVVVFLPCLLFSQIGPLASWENLKQYWIVVVYSLLFQLVSFIFGFIGVKLLRMPRWIIPCMIFNNTTSLPLLLLSSLGDNGTLQPIIGKDDSLSEAMGRGEVYLLLNTLVCNLCRFSFGPYLLEAADHEDDEDEEEHASAMQKAKEIYRAMSYAESPHMPIMTHPSSTVAEARMRTAPVQPLPTSYPDIAPYPAEAETSPLLHKTRVAGRRSWWTLWYVKEKMEGWLNPPMIGGLAAVTAGLIPFLRKALFDQGGALSPFAQSIEKCGKLYTALQCFVLGGSLYSAKGARPPIWPMVYLFTFRFAIIPVISTSIVYGFHQALKGVILEDPMLDFTMALSAVGPPALTLAAIVQMSNASEEVSSAVSQTIVLSYAVTPLISFSVTGIQTVVKSLYA